MEQSCDIAIIGGGIAAVSCAEALSELCPVKQIFVFSGSSIVKAVSNYRKIGRIAEHFDVEERGGDSVFEKMPNICLVKRLITKIDHDGRKLITDKGERFDYIKLCLCTGGRPKMICTPLVYDDCVLGLRDTDTVARLREKIANARRIMIVGNGGIATELVYELDQIEIVWIIKHESMSATFIDAAAAEFFLPHLTEKRVNPEISKRSKYIHSDISASSQNQYQTGDYTIGSALGPDWVYELKIPVVERTSCFEKRVHIEYETEVKNISADFAGNSPVTRILGESSDLKWPVYVELNNNKTIGCDVVVSATGVLPNTDLWVTNEGCKMKLADDGGIPVNDQMQTSIPDVYAAGDVCTANWDRAPHWVQMRLWTQGRQMGAYAARCIAEALNGRRAELDICFEIFTHVTNFFGFKVILLGRFNAQGLRNDEFEVLFRMKKGEEFVKVIVKDGRVEGALLIGETDLEETFENLILNQIDISAVKDDLLNPTVDIEDYFD